MKSCEEYQMEISAMLDGELRGYDLADTVKHIAGCQTCMAVFSDFQNLQEKVDAEIAPTQIPVGVWKRISKEIRHPQNKTTFIPFRSRFTKIIGIAAVLAISFLAGYLARRPAYPIIKNNEPIVLASEQGQMNNQQFIALTRELLTADPEYHRKMYFILHTLQSDYWEANYEPLDMDDYSTSIRVVQADGLNANEIFKF